MSKSKVTHSVSDKVTYWAVLDRTHVQQRVCCTKAVSSLSDFLCFSCWCSFFYLFMFSQVSFPIFILPTKQRCVSKKILFCLQLGYTFEPLLPAPASHSVKQFWAKAGRQGQARQGLGNKNTSCWPDTMFRRHFTFHDLLLFEGLLLQLAHDDDLWCCDWQPLLRLIERCSQLLDVRPLTPFSDAAAANWDGKWPTCQSMFTEINITHSVLCNCAIVHRSLCT